MKVVDNFLPEKDFEQIKSVLEGSDIPWYWNEESIPGKDNSYYDDTPQLCHTFISWDEDGAAIISPFFNIFKSTGCLSKLSAHSLVKFKANLNYRTSDNHVGGFHTDFQDEQKNGVTTSILYINTNNGGTQFEDGTRVKSIANSVMEFFGIDKKFEMTELPPLGDVDTVEKIEKKAAETGMTEQEIIAANMRADNKLMAIAEKVKATTGDSPVVTTTTIQDNKPVLVEKNEMLKTVATNRTIMEK